jgi:antitoxin component YwqK of YwqJK toxin-antitoxin module
MRNFILFAIFSMSSVIYANDIVTVASSSFLIEQEEGEINKSDEAGKKQGPWIIFGRDKPDKGYPEAGKIEEGPYKDDRKHGTWTKYFKDGTTPKLIGEYSTGRPKGEFTKFHGNGKVKSEGTYVNGKHQGELNRFYVDGTPSQVKNFNTEGKEEGAQKMYYPNGQVEVEYETKNGIKTGTQIRYTETGEVKQITTYGADGEIENREDIVVEEVVKEVETGGGGPTPGTNGKMMGKTFDEEGYNKVYNSDEELWMDGKFKVGKFWDGKIYKYDSDGILLKIEIWKNGKYHSDGQL